MHPDRLGRRDDVDQRLVLLQLLDLADETLLELRLHHLHNRLCVLHRLLVLMLERLVDEPHLVLLRQPEPQQLRVPPLLEISNLLHVLCVLARMQRAELVL